MAMQQRKRRRRSGGSNNNSVNPNKHFESNGPEVRIRGSAAQILDKYQQYARDAATSGDRVKAEALYQHAEHYARIVAQINKEQEKIRAEREAAKAEERAAREAEQRAEREAREQEARSEEEATASEAVTMSEAKAEADLAADDALESSGEDKPKRTRRRSYPRKKTAAEEEDGLAKTLARGAEADAG